MRKYSLLLLILIVSVSPVFSVYAEKKDPFYFGSCQHLGWQFLPDGHSYASAEKIVEMNKELGVNSYKDDLAWDVMRADEVPGLLPDTMHKISYSFDNLDARPLLILGANPHTIPDIQPVSEQSKQNYREYVEAAAKTLSPIKPIFEIWNEWNTEYKKEKHLGTPEAYIELIKTAYPIIKGESQDNLVLAGAVGDDKDWRWTLRAVELGMMQYADGLSLHPYNFCAWSDMNTGDDAIRWLKILHDKLKEKHPEQDIPFYISEMGWPDTGECVEKLSKDDIAIYFSQFLIQAVAYDWIKGAWFYEVRDQGEDSSDNREHHFGLYEKDGSKKPAAIALKNAWSFVKNGYDFTIMHPYPDVIKVAFVAENGSRKIAIWRTNKIYYSYSGPSYDEIYIPMQASLSPLKQGDEVNSDQWLTLSPSPLMINLPRGLSEDEIVFR